MKEKSRENLFFFPLHVKSRMEVMVEREYFDMGESCAKGDVAAVGI